jgi:carbon starvation protein
VIGYGGMLGEGTLALIATLAVSAGLANWAGHYDSFAVASKLGVANFVEGAGSFLVALSLPRGPAEVVVAVLVISFAATSLDTGVRIQRYILQELGGIYEVAPLRNRYVAGLIAVGLPLLLILGGRAGDLWHLFGSSNQLLAGLSLTVVMVWLFRTGRPWLPIAVPLVIVLVTAGGAMTMKLGDWIEKEDYLLAGIGTVILALEIWVVLEGVQAMRNRQQLQPSEGP